MSGKKKPESGGGRSAFMTPVQPDDALAAIIGSDPLPRTEITKKLFENSSG